MNFQVVEIGKGSKVKYELDKKSGLFKVGFLHTLPLLFSKLKRIVICIHQFYDYMFNVHFDAAYEMFGGERKGNLPITRAPVCVCMCDMVFIAGTRYQLLHKWPC